MVTAYVIIIGVGAVSIGSVLAERYLIQQEELGTAEMISKSMNITMKYGKFALVGYFLYKIVGMFY